MIEFRLARVVGKVTDEELTNMFYVLKRMDRSDPLVRSNLHAVCHELTSRDLKK